MNRILKTELVNWRDLKPLQPNLLKHQFNTSYIEKSLQKHGFAMPFFVWESKGNVYAIDGHTRIEVLSNMEDVPDHLPATFINAKNKKEAIQILLDVFNQKQNPIDEPILEEWLVSEDINIEEVEIETLNIKKAISLVELDDMPEKELSKMVAFALTVEEAELYNQIKDKIGIQNDKKLIFELINMYLNETGTD